MASQVRWNILSTLNTSAFHDCGHRYPGTEPQVLAHSSSLYSITCYLGIVVLTLLSTYLITRLQSESAVRSKKIGKDPPVMPYFIPFVGHTLAFAWSMTGVASSLMSRLSSAIPVKVRLLHMDMYIVSGAENIKTIFKHERAALPAGMGILLSLKNMFALPKPALDVYEADDSGMRSQPTPWSTVNPDHRIYHLTFKATTQMMSGPGLQLLASRFTTNLSSSIHESGIRLEWVNLPDICSFIQNLVFRPAMEAVCGPHMFSLNPTFAEDFWAFDKNILSLLKGYPRWISPKAWESRDRCLQAVKSWHQYANEHYDDVGIDPDTEYEPLFGAKFIRARQQYYSKIKSITADAKASVDLGLIWATNGNSIPTILWCLLEIIRNPNLLHRARAEVLSTVLPQTGEISPTFDHIRLCKLPLLQSIYAETLRLRVVIFHVRSAQNGDFQLGEWVLRQHTPILISSRKAHMDSEVWNTGNNSDPHPLDEFWAERFLVYPNDSNSGPLKKNTVPSGKGKPPPTSDSRTEGTDSDQSSSPRFTLDGLAGSWIPYGGGQRICPGRHFAKQEIILTLAHLILVFDFELQVPAGWKPEMDMRRAGLGALRPDKHIPFRVRRRVRY